MKTETRLTPDELGIVVITMSHLEPEGHFRAYYELRERLTREWAELDPEAYERAVRAGETYPVDMPGVGMEMREREFEAILP